MKKILCPTDFSDAAHNGIAYAAKLAQQIGSEITLFNVQSLFEVLPKDLFADNENTLELVSDQLEAQSREVSKAFKVSCYAEVTASIRPLSSIISSKADKFDFVIMGSNGPSDLFQLFTGSNTYNTIRHTKTPLLLVPENYVYTRPKKIVYAYDYVREGTLPLKPLVSFSKLLNCEVTILQIIQEAYSKEAESELHDVQQTIHRIYEDEITFGFDTVYSDNVSEAINEYALHHEPDMIALCHVHRNLIQRLFHKSVLRDLSAICEYPLFIFPE
jgi:nucleotide-binding universal stress UspA family protein